MRDGSVAPTLNNHLYSALLVKLRGPASDYASTRKDLHGDGIALLEALRQSYLTVLTPAELINVIEYWYLQSLILHIFFQTLNLHKK